ncbi:SH3 domain-containing protein [Phyllobacterium sp. 22229]|uniref:SH3 domain-containing protein n=1 Tax=Phyllobacterium sp. 22229 TaxID=3453895 RepID=UPI003F8531AE
MNMKSFLTLLIFCSTMIFSAGSAFADAAYTTGNVNLRTGPATHYARVGTLAAGTRVNVLACQSNWCRIGRQGIRGWVSANYLDRIAVHRPAIVVRPTIIVRPPYHHGHRPPHRPHRPRPNCKIAPGFSCR